MLIKSASSAAGSGCGAAGLQALVRRGVEDKAVPRGVERIEATRVVVLGVAIAGVVALRAGHIAFVQNRIMIAAGSRLVLRHNHDPGNRVRN